MAVSKTHRVHQSACSSWTTRTAVYWGVWYRSRKAPKLCTPFIPPTISRSHFSSPPVVSSWSRRGVGWCGIESQSTFHPREFLFYRIVVCLSDALYFLLHRGWRTVHQAHNLHFPQWALDSWTNARSILIPINNRYWNNKSHPRQKFP